MTDLVLQLFGQMGHCFYLLLKLLVDISSMLHLLAEVPLFLLNLLLQPLDLLTELPVLILNSTDLVPQLVPQLVVVRAFGMQKIRKRLVVDLF